VVNRACTGARMHAQQFTSFSADCPASTTLPPLHQESWPVMVPGVSPETTRERRHENRATPLPEVLSALGFLDRHQATTRLAGAVWGTSAPTFRGAHEPADPKYRRQHGNLHRGLHSLRQVGASRQCLLALPRFLAPPPSRRSASARRRL